MKLLGLGIFAVLLLGGCSSPSYVTGYQGPEQMQRYEVIEASRQCTHARMRPYVEYVRQDTKHGTRVLVPINVHCNPY
jgi:hypothetical protein